MKIYNIEPLDFSNEAKALYTSMGEYIDSSISDLEAGNLKDANVLIVRLANKIDSSVMDKLPSLKFISTATTGLDHIDNMEAERRGIEIISLRGEDDFLDTIPSTADLTFGLILSLLRNIPASYNDVLKNNWDRNKFRGYQLKGKNIGIIGMGRIGRILAKYCDAFGMNVGYYDVKKMPDGKYLHKSFDSVEELLTWSNIVSVHIHLTEENKNYLNAERLSNMKAGSWFINTSRGGIADEAVLANMIIDKKLRGVAVDVLSDELEGNINSNPLAKLARDGYNVIITPHIGGASFEAMHDCEIFMAKKLVNVLKGSGK